MHRVKHLLLFQFAICDLKINSQDAADNIKHLVWLQWEICVQEDTKYCGEILN